MSDSARRWRDPPGSPRPEPTRLQRAFVRAADGVLHGIASAGHLFPPARPSLRGVHVEHDVPYLDTGDPRHRLDIYHPPSSTRRRWPLAKRGDASHEAAARGHAATSSTSRSRQAPTAPPAMLVGTATPGLPVILYAHGGGFRWLSTKTHWLMALTYARQGYLVFNVGYRLARQYPFPSPLEDVCAAYRWVVENAARYGGDPTRIAVAGESAGGNLITALTLAACYRRPEPFAERVWETGVVPRAALPACALLQTSDPARYLERWPELDPIVQAMIRRVCEGYLPEGVHAAHPSLELASPLQVLERGQPPDRPLPPFFIPCGTHDPMIDDAQRLETSLAAVGGRVRARYYEDEIHAFHVLIYTPAARRCWRDIFEFLDEHLGASERPLEERLSPRE